MKTWHIYINGIVQGVGFRPLVYLLAKQMQLNGYVINSGNGLNIFVNATEGDARLLLRKIKSEAPQQSKIISAELLEAADEYFTDFSIIVNQHDADEKQVLISPDVAICATCQSELSDSSNRRYRYPFITCTQCGPRYSIIKDLPYERHDTTMQPFTMCKNCMEEYNNVADRRFFSQTNSCPQCGVQLTLHESSSSVLSDDTEQVLSHIKDCLAAGKILAVKGIGGYLLMCDADNNETIKLLRNRKHRPAKPFALLYPNIKSIENSFELSLSEKNLLESAEAPIVLLQPKPETSESISTINIAPGLNRLGVMLPANPLLQLIAMDFGKPLIATSANISGSPIIYRDEDAMANLFEIADYVIGYNLEIIVPQDDSVVQISKHSNQQIILRRSRGYTPSFLSYRPKTDNCVLSTGAFLKSTFTLAVNGNTFVSQFLGSGESYESQQMYNQTLSHWLKLYAATPDVIIADKHSGYFSTQYAIQLAEETGIEVKLVQHHEAHFAAVLAEHDLLHDNQPVLGVIWDGTGLGNDKNLWGGEFFKYENNTMLRCYHFDYFPVIAGDKMALEPRISALCASTDAWPQSNKVKEKFTEQEINNYQALIENTTLFTSSVGRIFDAVASLLDLCNKQSYEGEAAMYLQVLAEDYVAANGFVMDHPYFKEGSHYYRIPTASLMQGVIMDIKKGKAKSYIAAKFHYSLVCLVDIIAGNTKTEKICFSGGVFQNALLVDWIKHMYSAKYQLYFHKHLSPNDENISFGQLVYYENGISTVATDTLKKENFEKEIIEYISAKSLIGAEVKL